MNINKFKQLRDHLKHLIEIGETTHFNMSTYMGDAHLNDFGFVELIDIDPSTTELAALANDNLLAKCDTAACLAGWACILNAGEKPDDYRWDHPRDAAEILGLNADQAYYVFMGHWTPNDVCLEDISIEVAVEYLDAVIERERVDVGFIHPILD